LKRPAAANLATGFALTLSGPEVPDFEVPVAPRERAVALLHIGAEVEHALMVQYLFAAYSLNESQEDPRRREFVRKWKSTVAEIAREEMGHLATVENALTLIGGALCFERDDYPIVDSELWPFPLQLEPLTRDSLAKYVLAEMPSEESVAKLGLTKEIEAIKKRLGAVGHLNVHRVGLIYSAILKLLTAGPMIQGPDVPGVTDPHAFIATIDIQSSNANYQVNPSAWGLGYGDILIEVAHDRPSALDGITAIAVQGEGNDVDQDLNKSHFGKFLQIYREFPEQSEWQPARNVAVNPSTNPSVTDPSRRLEGEARLWAALSNLRYHMLLFYLKHSFYIEAPSKPDSPTPRGALISWAFGEMYNLRSLSEILMSMPMTPQAERKAGPPFEMPYSLSLPTRASGRWRTHRDLLLASLDLTEKMLVPGQPMERYLRALRAADLTALEQITSLIGA
jgi:hypothetical protein